MVDNIKLKIVCSLDLDKTPVIRGFIGWLKNNTNIHLQTVKANRLIYNGDCQIYVGNRSLLPLFFGSYFVKGRLFYWALESYTGFENSSKILLLTRIQYLINWKRVEIIYPIRERQILMPISFKRVHIIPNLPKLTNCLESLLMVNKSKFFIHYGELKNDRVFTKEVLLFAMHLNEEIDLYGKDVDLNDFGTGINFYGVVPHKLLMEKLQFYRFGFVGYRPVNFNTKYSAPNKLFEMMSKGVIPLVSSDNSHLISFLISPLQIFDWGKGLNELVVQFNKLKEIEDEIRLKGIEKIQNEYNSDLAFSNFWKQIELC